ncbi:hypothetical protein AAEX28_07190 [Lentisphaerota bacterium WC36G]|nr:hypothetical protein LJT99_10055 [Lentisphaerae bacterium WC36]
MFGYRLTKDSDLRKATKIIEQAQQELDDIKEIVLQRDRVIFKLIDLCNDNNLNRQATQIIKSEVG